MPDRPIEPQFTCGKPDRKMTNDEVDQAAQRRAAKRWADEVRDALGLDWTVSDASTE